MAEEISAKNNQTDRIKNGKTLGEIINDLPMVKNLRKSAPKQLGKYDFSPAIIAALKNQGEISDSITINSIMSAKEEDFIKNSFGSLIEQTIGADVQKNFKGIVISNGRVDIDASIEEQRRLGINPEEMGGAFAKYGKEDPKEQREQKNLNDQKILIDAIKKLDIIGENRRKAISVRNFYRHNRSFDKNDFEQFIKDAKEGKNLFEITEQETKEAEIAAQEEADKYIHAEDYTEEELIDYGQDFEEKKR